MGFQHGTMVAFEPGGGIFFQFPLRYVAHRADRYRPFVPDPSAGPAVQGVADHENLIAVGGEFSCITCYHNRPDAMELPGSGWPQLDFGDQVEQPGPLPVKPFFCRPGLFFFCFCCHVML